MARNNTACDHRERAFFGTTPASGAVSRSPAGSRGNARVIPPQVEPGNDRTDKYPPTDTGKPCFPLQNWSRTSPRAQAGLGSVSSRATSSGRSVSMNELTEKTALPAPAAP